MAAVTASLQVRGLKELDALLARLPDEVEERVMAAALRAGGAVIERAAKRNIRNRTGRTAADIRMEVQVQPGTHEGVAAIGGTFQGKTGRAHVLRWLEMGTRPHRIVAGASERALARRAQRALRAIGERGAATALGRGIRTGAIRVRRALSMPGGVFRAAVQHPGARPQSPLTRALAEQSDRVLAVFGDALWRGIVQAARRLQRGA